MMYFPVATALAMLVFVAGCGKTQPANSDAQAPKNNLVQPADGTGCIQGSVINGLTGERLDLPASDAATGLGVTVRVRDQLVTGAAMATKLAQNPSMKGEYALCGVPLEDDFPVYVNVDGFQPYASVVHLASSVAQRSAQADADIQKPTPTGLYNFRLYPVGVQTQDLKVHVTYAAAPVKGATVSLVPSDKNVLDSGSFLPPDNGDLLTLAATTDDAGNAVFAAAKLELGGVYDYTVIPTAGAATTTVHVAAGITVGLLAAKADHDAYTVNVDLDDTAPALAVVSESREPAADGSKTCVFNRAVQLAPGTVDGITATLSGSTQAALKTDVPGNNASESATIAIATDGLSLTLTPNWATNPDFTKEPNITVTYTGIVLEPANTPDQSQRFTLADHCKLTVTLDK